MPTSKAITEEVRSAVMFHFSLPAALLTISGVAREHNGAAPTGAPRPGMGHLLVGR